MAFSGISGGGLIIQSTLIVIVFFNGLREPWQDSIKSGFVEYYACTV
jgi:hypothetical protein